METKENSSVAVNWIQVGGQDPNLEVNYLSSAWWWEVRDRRADHLPMMMSPSAVVLASSIYVALVTWIGPRFMQKRDPYSLKHTILVYNLFQVVINGYVLMESWDAAWGRHYNWSKYLSGNAETCEQELY